MRRVKWVILLSVVVSAAGLGWDWPVPGGFVVAGIGPYREGAILPGILIAGNRESVQAAADGEVVFALDPQECRHCLPSVLGTTVVLHHERGFRTVYGHLESMRDLRGGVISGTVLGDLGQSGAALGRRLFFQVVDSQRGVAVNPLLVLPAVQDSEPPRIGAVDLVQPNAPSEVVENRRIAAEIVDVLPTAGREAEVFPYSVELLVDGQLKFELVLDAIGVDDAGGGWITVGGVRLSDVANGSGRLDLGMYPVVPGVTVIEVIATDHVGNAARRRISVPTGSENSAQDGDRQGRTAQGGAAQEAP